MSTLVEPFFQNSRILDCLAGKACHQSVIAIHSSTPLQLACYQVERWMNPVALMEQEESVIRKRIMASQSSQIAIWMARTNRLFNFEAGEDS